VPLAKNGATDTRNTEYQHQQQHAERGKVMKAKDIKDTLTNDEEEVIVLLYRRDEFSVDWANFKTPIPQDLWNTIARISDRSPWGEDENVFTSEMTQVLHESISLALRRRWSSWFASLNQQQKAFLRAMEFVVPEHQQEFIKVMCKETGMEYDSDTVSFNKPAVPQKSAATTTPSVEARQVLAAFQLNFEPDDKVDADTLIAFVNEVIQKSQQ
jgi:hypothetical protein